MSPNATEFLGRGWAFPPEFSGRGRTCTTVADVADIEQSLEILLSTRPGERLGDPSFGCDLSPFQFGALTRTRKTFIADLLTTAILYHESRIEVLGVTFDDSRQLEGVVVIEVAYRVRSTNSRRNFVFPFYTSESGR